MMHFLKCLLLSTFVLSFLLIVPACNNAGESNGPKETEITTQPIRLIFDRLIGTWRSKNGKSFERWGKNADTTYRSTGFSVNGNDTSWNEQAHVFPEKDNWVFENTVKDQNDGKAVRFISSLLKENSVQFSNPAHDFPTDINYTLPDDNTIHAFIVGPNAKGGKDTVRFIFQRIN